MMLPDEILCSLRFIGLIWVTIGIVWAGAWFWWMTRGRPPVFLTSSPQHMCWSCTGFWGICLTVRMCSSRSPVVMLVMSVLQCWGDQITWHDWPLGEMRTRYLSLCGMEVQLVEVHVSAYELDASFDSGRTYMVACRLFRRQERVKPLKSCWCGCV